MKKIILFLILSLSIFSATTKVTTPKIQEIKLNETVIIPDSFEFTIDSSNILREVYPTIPDKSYTVFGGNIAYFECNSQKAIFINLILKIKNLNEDTQIFDKTFDITVIYNNKYKYTPIEQVFEDDSGEFFTPTQYYPVDPLRTELLHSIIEIPLDISNDDKPLAILIKVKNKEYKYIIR